MDPRRRPIGQQLKELPDKTRWASFDLGYRHLSHGIYQTHLPSIRKITRENKKLIRAKREDRDPQIYQTKVVEPLFDQLHIGFMKTADLGEKYNPLLIKFLVLDYMEEHKKQWDKVDAVIIEQQLTGGGKFGVGTNVKAIRIEEIVWSYFYHRYPKIQIYIYNSRTKTTRLGAPLSLANNKPSRKRWTEEFFEAQMRRRDHRYLVPLLDWKNQVRGKRKSKETEDMVKKLYQGYPTYVQRLADRVVIERIKIEELADITCQLVAFFIQHIV